MRDRHRHPSSRATSTDEIVDRELEAAIEDGELLEPEIDETDKRATDEVGV
jgi:hypothetical protein